MMMANLPSMGQPEPPLVLHVIHHLYVGGMENGLVNLINNMPPDDYRHATAWHRVGYARRMVIAHATAFGLACSALVVAVVAGG